MLFAALWENAFEGSCAVMFFAHTALVALFVVAAGGIAGAQVSPEVAAHVKAGIQARQEKRYPDARRELEAAAQLAPQIAAIHLNLGLTYHEQGELSLAVASFEKALALKPEVKGARSLIGFDLLTLGRYDAAVDQLEKAYAENPTAQVSAWLGMAYLKSGQAGEGIPLLEAALDAQPANADLLYYLAKAHGIVSAQAQLALLRSAPESARAHQAIADDHALNGRTDEAIAEYELALQSDAQVSGVHSALGDLYRDASRHEDAARHYALELQQTPDDLDVRHHYGATLLQLGQAGKAVPHLKAAVAGDPTRADAHFDLGKALFDQGELNAARKDFQAVLANNPSLQQAMSAHYELARILRRQEEPEAAARHLNEFRTLRGHLIRAEQQ